MNYAYKTPNGLGIFRVVIGQPLEDETKTIEEADLWPVDATIPEGKVQDFSAANNGWYLDNGTVKACVMDAPPQQVPQSITLLQLRLWLIENGMLSTVENIIATRANWPSEKAHDEAKTRWQFRTDVLRSSDMVNTLGAALGLTQEQIDAAFIAADRLS